MVDTGPPYPPLPGPQSNQIGTFQVGISPLGTIPPFDYWQTVISQYANSPHLIALIANFDAWLDQTQNFDSFYSNIWNLPTANGYGLDVWGRIVGIPRNVIVGERAPYFSFDDPALGFDNAGAPIWVNQPLIVTVNATLEDDDYRWLIYAKAATNICDGSVPLIMNSMNKFFGNYRTPVFINETNMNPMSYQMVQVGETISLTNLAVFSSGAISLKPAGIAASYYVVSQSGPAFGFDIENDQMAGFDHGVITMNPSQYILASI